MDRLEEERTAEGKVKEEEEASEDLRREVKGREGAILRCW